MSPTDRRASESPVLAAKGLRQEYGDLIALAPSDLQVLSGELVALVGSNGAGKTTLMGIAAGLVEPSHGAIHICGAPAGSLTARARTSYVPDTPVFYQDLSLNEHLEYIARLHGAEDWQTHASRLLEQLGLEQWGDKLPTQFSRGMRQKASIALGLIRPFSLLLADEPFDGLDPASRDVLVEMLRTAVLAQPPPAPPRPRSRLSAGTRSRCPSQPSITLCTRATIGSPGSAPSPVIIGTSVPPNASNASCDSHMSKTWISPFVSRATW